MPSLSKQLHDHPNEFELKSLLEVPDSHAWPTLHDHPASDPSGPDAVPVVDLASPDAVARIGQACREWGAFYITGHGVPVNLLDRLEFQILRLFSLPADQKLKAARGPGGDSGYGPPTISAFFSKNFWFEGFTVVGSPRDNARRLWPEDYNEFCVVVEQYIESMKELTARLVRLMLLSLGLTDADIVRAGPLKDCSQVDPVLQLNSYPACPDPDRAIGLAAHNDSSLITILHQSSTSGLQVFRAEDQAGLARWVTVPPLAGALIVNVGDLFHILSNGRFHNVLHRAIVNRTQHRVSAAYFCGPPANVEVSPIDKLMDPDEVPVYQAVTWSEYLKLKRKFFRNTLAAIKMTEEKGDQECLDKA